MFTVPKVNVVYSDEGFSVEVLGRTGIEYCEGGKSMSVDSEVLATGHGIAVFRNSIKGWRSPHEKEQITSAERQRILENIRRAIEFRNQPIEIL
jgi:Immunity protein 74